MPAVSCRCRFPSFLYRVYQPTLRRAEVSPRACVALCAFSRARGRRHVHKRQYGTAERRLKCSRRNLSATSSRAKFLRPECFKRTAVAAPDAKQGAFFRPPRSTDFKPEGESRAVERYAQSLSMKKIAFRCHTAGRSR